MQKREAPAGEKPEPVRTRLRNMRIVPEMIGSVIGVYNGKTFNQVEIKVSAWDISHFVCMVLLASLGHPLHVLSSISNLGLLLHVLRELQCITSFLFSWLVVIWKKFHFMPYSISCDVFLIRFVILLTYPICGLRWNSLRWLVTTWPSFPSRTSRWSTEGLVLELPTLLGSSTQVDDVWDGGRYVPLVYIPIGLEVISVNTTWRWLKCSTGLSHLIASCCLVCKSPGEIFLSTKSI